MRERGGETSGESGEAIEIPAVWETFSGGRKRAWALGKLYGM